MENITTLKTLAGLAIDHDANFEIYHGETTHKDKRTRAQMILSLEGCPDVRILFGDKKHGQRLSSIHLAGNSKITIKQEHLLEALAKNSTTTPWRRIMENDTNVINIFPAANNEIKITGTIAGEPKTLTDETGTYHWHEYEILIENLAFSPTSQEVFTLEPTRFLATIPHIPGATQTYKEGTELELTGDYIFPATIHVNTIKETP